MTQQVTASRAPTPSLGMNRFFKNQIVSRLKKITDGQITLSDHTGDIVCGGHGELKARLAIQHPDAYYLIALKGALGASEGYIRGLWTCDDLYSLVRIFVANSDVLDSFEKGTAALKNILAPFFHFAKRNSVAGSRKNIHEHYDLSNELFQTFLDPRMMYSAAFFETEDATLEDASTAKLERICRKLNLQATDHVIEIGTGWGGFAIYAAENFGCQVTTTTISDRQYDLAMERVREKNLQDKITLLKNDYRDLTGQFDKLVSIEMIEAVGADYLPAYLKKCADLLKPEGSLLIQAITINDQIYDRALGEVDFIKKYIFPGSFIPSLHAIASDAKHHTDLRLYDLEDMTPHYVRTLLEWQKRFNDRFADIKALGFDETFQRMWNYYFSYCAGGFAERSIGSVQLLMGKPKFRDSLSLRTHIQK